MGGVILGRSKSMVLRTFRLLFSSSQESLLMTSALSRRSFLGTSGQTIDDIFKYLESENRMEIVQQTLEWSHLAPTCPDTLCLSLYCSLVSTSTELIHGSGVETGCYPFTDRDPFILNETPHVYFIGNQPKFESRLVTDEEGEGSKKCRIVLVPKFCETGQVVLVHSKSLETKVVGFEC